MDNSKIFQAFENTVEIVNTHSISQAVEEAYKLAENGEVVLLSPACASFDLFKNYEDRGSKFKEEVSRLKYKIEQEGGDAS